MDTVKRTEVYLDDDQDRLLTERAERLSTTKPALIRQAIDDFLGQEAQEARLARLRAAIDDLYSARPSTFPRARSSWRSYEGRAPRSSSGSIGTGGTMGRLVDTTVLVDLLRHRPEARAFLHRLEDPASASEVTRIELLQGLRSHEQREALKLTLAAANVRHLPMFEGLAPPY